MTRNIRIFAIFLSVASLALSYGLYLLKPVATQADFKDFSIEHNTGFSEIAVLLERAGLIRSIGAFKIYAFLSGVGGKIKAGNHWLSPAQSLPQILETLVDAEKIDQSVAIIEGWTLREIDDRLSKAGIIRGGSLLSLQPEELRKEYPFLLGSNSLEGFLFPDTYRFFKESSAEAVARKFLDNFRDKTQSLLSGSRAYRTLIIASLLEKEVRSFKDRQIVAGIIEKRLKLGMPLQIDATICYAENKSFSECYPLSRSDFEIDSPYNTYKRAGLPPAPIGNPGLEAIKAALTPKLSTYLYYLSDPKTGRTVFASTFEEHNENRARYLGL